MIKLKIDLHSGIIEVEGDDVFVKEVYKDYKDSLGKSPSHKPPQPPTIKTHGESGKSDDDFSDKKKRRANAGAPPKFLHEFESQLNSGKVTLKQFYSERNGETAFEKNVVFVDFLERTLGITNVTVDHVYTCYQSLGERPPTAFRQSILDTASKKFWLNTTDMQNIKVTSKGHDLVMFEIPGRAAKNKKNDE